MSKLIDINPTHLDIVKTILQKNLPLNTKIWIFGSRAKQTAKKYSDLDLALQVNHDKIPFATLANLANDFEQSDLTYKVDLVDLNSVDDQFQSLIAQSKIPLVFQLPKQHVNATEIFADINKKYTKPGALLRGIRIRENLTQVKMATLLKVTQSDISQMEQGIRNIGRTIAKRIEKLFGIDYKSFLQQLLLSVAFVGFADELIAAEPFSFWIEFSADTG